MPHIARIGTIGKLKNIGKKVAKSAEKAVTSQSDQSQSNDLKANQPEASAPASSLQILYVSKTKGSNKNDGSLATPLKEIDKAIELSAPGGEIRVAGGRYSGTLNVGFFVSDKPVRKCCGIRGAIENKFLIFSNEFKVSLMITAQFLELLGSNS